jgi:hypothetical protein
MLFRKRNNNIKVCIINFLGITQRIGSNIKLIFYFNFRTVHFVLCLGITNKCINSYQLNNSLAAPTRFGNYYQPKPQLARNLEGTDELPEDDT